MVSSDFLDWVTVALLHSCLEQRIARGLQLPTLKLVRIAIDQLCTPLLGTQATKYMCQLITRTRGVVAVSLEKLPKHVPHNGVGYQTEFSIH